MDARKAAPSHASAILLVEDSGDDVQLTLEAFAQAKMLNPVEVVRDGIEALAYLRKNEKHHSAQTPAVILLDLHMPKKSGFELLREMKDDPELGAIPVIVLTDSYLDINVLKSYGCNPDAFLGKPVNIEDFLDAVRKFDGFRLVVAGPSRKQSST